MIEQLENIQRAIESLEDCGQAKTICLDVETYNLISIIGSNITDQLTRIADALEEVEDTYTTIDLTKEEA